MRLIDADELMDLLRLRKNSNIGTDIEEIPTVKAIPVEWMKHWAMKNWVKSKNCEYDIIVSKMIEDWEKENEVVQ